MNQTKYLAVASANQIFRGYAQLQKMQEIVALTTLAMELVIHQDDEVFLKIMI